MVPHKGATRVSSRFLAAQRPGRMLEFCSDVQGVLCGAMPLHVALEAALEWWSWFEVMPCPTQSAMSEPCRVQ